MREHQCQDVRTKFIPSFTMPVTEVLYSLDGQPCTARIEGFHAAHTAALILNQMRRDAHAQ